MVESPIEKYNIFVHAEGLQKENSICYKTEGGKEMDIFEIEDFAHYASMMVGNMDNMKDAIESLGGMLVGASADNCALMEALLETLDEKQISDILDIKNRKISEYFGRYTTDEMKEQFAKAGFAGLLAVIVDADFADKAIDEGFDVYELKAGEQKRLNHYHEASEAEAEGYIITVAPHVCDAMEKIFEGDEEYCQKYQIEDAEFCRDMLWHFFDEY